MILFLNKLSKSYLYDKRESKLSYNNCSSIDHSLFYFHNQSICMFVLFYVDDVVVTSNNVNAITGLIHELGKELEVILLGYLGFMQQPWPSSSPRRIYQRPVLYGRCKANFYTLSCRQQNVKINGDLLENSAHFGTLTRWSGIAYSVNFFSHSLPTILLWRSMFFNIQTALLIMASTTPKARPLDMACILAPVSSREELLLRTFLPLSSSSYMESLWFIPQAVLRQRRSWRLVNSKHS